MKITKLIRVCLTVIACLALSLTSSTAVEAAGTVFHIENQKGKAGDTVTVTVSLSTSVGLGGVQAEMYYDKDVLTFYRVKKNDLLNEAGGIFDYNHIEEESKITLVFLTLGELNENGKFVDISFKLKKDCKKELPIALKLTSVLDSSDEGKEISATVTGASKDYENKVFGGETGQPQDGSEGNSGDGSEGSGTKTDSDQPSDTSDSSKTPSGNEGTGDKNSAVGDGSAGDASGDGADEPGNGGADTDEDGESPSGDMNFGEPDDSKAEKEKGNSSGGLIIVVVAAVIAVAGAAVILIIKKRKKH